MIRVLLDCITETKGQYAAYVKIYDDKAPETILAEHCLEYEDKEQFKDALRGKIGNVKENLSQAEAVRAEIIAALNELASEEQ